MRNYGWICVFLLASCDGGGTDGREPRAFEQQDLGTTEYVGVLSRRPVLAPAHGAAAGGRVIAPAWTEFLVTTDMERVTVRVPSALLDVANRLVHERVVVIGRRVATPGTVTLAATAIVAAP
jgi:hypothetical protein